MGRGRALAGVFSLALLGTLVAGPALAEQLAERPGTALRLALALARRGDVEQGAARVARIGERHPEIADHAGLLEAELWLEAGRAEEALRAALRAIAGDPRSPILHRLHRAVGDAHRAAGAEAQARAAWESALAAGPPGSQRAVLQLAGAESLERDGLLEAAARAYARLWVERPTAPEASRAAERLDALEARLERSFRSNRDWRRRGDLLFRHNHTESALAAYETALARGLTIGERHRAERQRAHCLFRMRRYKEAVEAFGALGKDDEARLWQARARARSGQVERAIAELEAIGRRPTGRLAVWAQLLAALLLEDEGEIPRARTLYASVANFGRQRDFEGAALWRLGWTAWREKRFDEARERLEVLAVRDPDPIDRLRARYWAARSLEEKDPEAARAALDRLAIEYPFSYYGWRAAQRIGRPAGGGEGAVSLPRGRVAIPERELARPRILLEAGLTERALGELARLEGSARGLSDRLDLARLYADAGSFDGARRVLVIPYAETLARGPAQGFEEVWWLSWPDAYAELVRESVAGDALIVPELVFAVMREESGYQPDAVSTAGALGLLQIMPSTGTRLADQLGLAGFAPHDLLQPPVNIRLGGFYLDRLTRRFDGNLSAAVASYNAGPEAVARWLAATPLDDDEWVEAIPYSQTRAYVKRVLRSFEIYRVLY